MGLKVLKIHCPVIVCLLVFSPFVSKGQDSRNTDTKHQISKQSPFHWQGLLQEDGMDYRAVMKRTSEFFRQNPQQKEKQEETYKAFIRWKLFWQSRMSKAGHAKTGPWYANKINKDQD